MLRLANTVRHTGISTGTKNFRTHLFRPSTVSSTPFSSINSNQKNDNAKQERDEDENENESKGEKGWYNKYFVVVG